MKLNRKVIGAILGVTGVVAITAAVGCKVPMVEKNVEVCQVTDAALEDEAIAGVTAALYEYQKGAAVAVSDISVESEDLEVVSTSVEESVAEVEEQATEEQVTEELTEEEMQWQDYLMANVEQSLNVRAHADENSKIVGKLYKGDRAKILNRKYGWIKIESGNVKGYVKNEYCLTGSDALDYAKATCDTIATVNIDGLRIRSKQSTEGPVITAVAAGTELKVKTSKKTKEDWVAVVYENDVCYVSEDYVDLSLKTGKGVTLEEEAAAREAEEAAKKAAAEAEAAKKAQEAQKAVASSGSSSSQTQGAATTQGSAVNASVDDVTLLAAIIQCEAGGCSYEGKLAVGAVVMNRVKSRSFPNTISGVIYQSGQFSPARTGKLARRLASGVSSSCRQAAQAALSGQDNTNGAKYFKYASSGQPGVVYGTVVFY